MKKDLVKKVVAVLGLAGVSFYIGLEVGRSRGTPPSIVGCEPSKEGSNEPPEPSGALQGEKKAKMRHLTPPLPAARGAFTQQETPQYIQGVIGIYQKSIQKEPAKTIYRERLIDFLIKHGRYREARKQWLGLKKLPNLDARLRKKMVEQDAIMRARE